MSERGLLRVHLLALRECESLPASSYLLQEGIGLAALGAADPVCDANKRFVFIPAVSDLPRNSCDDSLGRCARRVTFYNQ